MIVANTGDLLGSNMYAYCKNNPVNMEDQDGDIATLIAVGTGALIGVGVQVISDIIRGEVSSLGTYASAAFTGALSSGTSAMAVAARIIGGALIKNVIDSGNKKENWDWGRFGKDILLNAGGELISGVSQGIVSKYQYKKNYSQTANTLRKSGKYDGYNKVPVYKKLNRATNIRFKIGTLQNWSVAVGYSVVTSPY